MKELFLIVLKYYAIVGIICALLAGAWVSILSVYAEHILNRGNTVRLTSGRTFTPDCNRTRMVDYFVICLGVGIFIVTFFTWPLMLYKLITNRKWWCMVEEVHTRP